MPARSIAFALLALLVATQAARAQGAVVMPPLNQLPPAKVDNLPPAQDLDATRHTTCAVAAGEVWCWGDCQYGHCDGKQGAEAEPTPQKVPGLKNVARVSVAPIAACALHGDGGVSCWGTLTGLLDQRETPQPPRRVKGLPKATALSVGPGTACAIGADRQVRCWGNNYSGELGQGPVFGPYKPRPRRRSQDPGKLRVQPLDPVTLSTPAIVRVGVRESLKPLVVRGASDAIALAVGDAHACAIRRGGNVVCWGAASMEKAAPPRERRYDGDPAELDDGPEEDRIIRDGTLHEIPLPAAAVAINATDRHSCAILDDGRMLCWNYYTMATPLVGPDECHNPPVLRTLDDHGWYALTEAGAPIRAHCNWQMKPEPGVPAVVENSLNCARTADGEVWCWGTNERAQLGRPAEPLYRR